MNNEPQHDDLIDLGAASIETKGPTAGVDDSRSGSDPVCGPRRRVKDSARVRQ